MLPQSPFDKTVQVAGVASLAEARLLIDCGVDYLGFPLRLPVHREDVDTDTAREIVSHVGAARAVVITYLDVADDIISLVTHVGAETVQLHGPVPDRELQLLRAKSAGLLIIKSVIVRPGEIPPPTEPASEIVDAYIVDTFDPHTGASGATGKTHDWSTSRAIVSATSRPVILAGGLTPDNVAQAIQAVAPAAVDVHTGVEDPGGAKSRARVEAFVTAAHAAFKSA